MQPRNQVLDNIKALGIIAVIVGHVSHIAPLSSWIYGFHMPLFFFLAGITWYFDSKQNFLLKKAKGLIVPYITFGLTSFAYWLLIESKFRGDPVTAQVVFDQMKSFAGVIVGGGKDYVFNVVLWFLPCLFFVEVFLLFLSKLEAGKYISIGIAFVLMGLSCLYFRIIDYKMPWRADIAISILPLVMLAQALCGGFLKFTEQRNLKMDCLLAILAFTMSLSIIWFDVKINLFAYQYPTPFYLLYICPLGGILLFTIASKYIRSQIMEYIGKNSLTIMLVHEPIKRIVIKVVSVCTGLDMEQVRSQILYVAIITLFTLCISLLLCLFINRYAPWMVSKNKQIP